MNVSVGVHRGGGGGNRGIRRGGRGGCVGIAVGTGGDVGRGVLVEAGKVAVWMTASGVGVKYGIGVGGKCGT